MELIGKMYMSAVCPLCNYTYLLDKSEYQHIGQKIQDAYVDKDFTFHGAQFEERIQFYCPECGKTMKSDKYSLVNYTDEFVKQVKKEMEDNEKK